MVRKGFSKSPGGKVGMVEFWNEMLTRESWEKLLELSKEYKFIVIGGWAAYVWTHAHKSKDIDIVVGYDELRRFGANFRLEKNERMGKYEIKMDKFDIDIYLPAFSKLAIPLEELGKLCTKIEGLEVPKPEALAILKQAAEIGRRGSIKAKKDAIDLLSILIHAPFEWGEYSKLAKRYGLSNYPQELLHVIRNFDEKDIHYLGVGFVEFKKLRKKWIEEIRGIR
jgi:hypothetical protein